MGGIGFTARAKAKNPGKAYDELVEEAIYYHGHDPYNGTISTCDLGRCTLSFPTFKEENLEKAYAHIEERDYGEKWTAAYVDLGKTKGGFHEYLFYGIAAC